MNIPKTIGADYAWIDQTGKAGASILSAVFGPKQTTPAPAPSMLSSLMPVLAIGGIGLIGYAIISKKK